MKKSVLTILLAVGVLGLAGATGEAKAGVNISFGLGLPVYEYRERPGCGYERVYYPPRVRYVEPCERVYYPQYYRVYYGPEYYYRRHHEWREERHCH